MRRMNAKEMEIVKLLKPYRELSSLKWTAGITSDNLITTIDTVVTGIHSDIIKETADLMKHTYCTVVVRNVSGKIVLRVIG